MTTNCKLPEFVACPVCLAYVDPEDLEDHLEQRHPDSP